VAQEPGFCCNGGQYTGFDLIFDEQPPLIRTGPHDLMTPEEVREATVRVTCRDCGAWTALYEAKPGEWQEGGLIATVRVQVVPQEANTMDQNAYLETDPTLRYARIPVDSDSNHIADTWQYNNGLANDDDDSQPPGDGTPGDGLSRYEEYRGFLLDEEDYVLSRLNPTQKDMFVTDADPESLGTTQYFQDAGMPTPHWLDLFGWSWAGRVLNFINYNHDTAHVADVYSVYMAAQPVPGHPDWWGGSWNWYYHPGCDVLINVSLIQQVVVPPHTWEEFRNSTIGHELGHTVLHHRPDGGHHDVENPQDCLMGPYGGPADPVYPEEFCATLPGTEPPQPGCQRLWHFAP